MALTYKNFTKVNIDLSLLGWAGVDGIHYCTVRGFGDMTGTSCWIMACQHRRPTSAVPQQGCR